LRFCYASRHVVSHLRTLGARLLGLGLAAAVTCAAAEDPYLRYEGTSHLARSDRTDPFLLRKYLYPALKEAGIRRIEVVAGRDSVVQERSASGMMYLDGIPPAALHAVLLMLPAKQAGAEVDLWVQGKGTLEDPDRMWTVRRDLAGGIVVLKGSPPLALEGPDPSPAALATRFGIGALEDSADARWSADERRALEKALELLSPRELELIAGVSFRRERLNKQGNAGFHESGNGGEPSRITVFDSAFQKSQRFVEYTGAHERAVPVAVMVVLHEIGHALSDAERRALLIRRRTQSEDYEAGRASYTALSQEYERLRNPPQEDAEVEAQRERLLAELERLRAELQTTLQAIESIDAEVQQLASGSRSVRARYAALPGATDGPTEYGRTTSEESFAEAFALYRIDPESLRWISPQTHAWFAQDEHLRSDAPGLPDVAAPPDPGTNLTQ
jgi:hypothetical protein